MKICTSFYYASSPAFVPGYSIARTIQLSIKKASVSAPNCNSSCSRAAQLMQFHYNS